MYFFSAVILLHDITVIYYICAHYILFRYPKNQGWHRCLGQGTLSLIFPPVSFSGTSFPALMHLVFKALKHTATVNTK